MGLEKRVEEFGAYRPLELLAEGGTARVYRAEGPRGEVALKVFRAPLSPASSELAGCLQSLDHPNLARILDFDREWAAMEFLEGPNLEELLSAGPLPLDRALSLAARMAEGLAVLHEAGWVHRDLKPSNVIVLEGDWPKIVDFGLARRVGAPSESASFEGSWGYVAPEQVRGEEADPRSDVYALGVVLYRMVLGHLPFGDAPVAAALGHLHERAPSPRVQNPAIPAAVDGLLLRALAKEAQDRFPTMKDFAAALREAADARVEVEPRKGSWIPAVGVAVAVSLVAAHLAC